MENGKLDSDEMIGALDDVALKVDEHSLDAVMVLVCEEGRWKIVTHGEIRYDDLEQAAAFLRTQAQRCKARHGIGIRLLN